MAGDLEQTRILAQEMHRQHGHPRHRRQAPQERVPFGVQRRAAHRVICRCHAARREHYHHLARRQQFAGALARLAGQPPCLGRARKVDRQKMWRDLGHLAQQAVGQDLRIATQLHGQLPSRQPVQNAERMIRDDQQPAVARQPIQIGRAGKLGLDFQKPQGRVEHRLVLASAVPGPVLVQPLQLFPPAQPFDRSDQPAAEPALPGVRIGKARHCRRRKVQPRKLGSSQVMSRSVAGHLGSRKRRVSHP